MSTVSESMIRHVVHPLWARLRDPGLYPLWQEYEQTQFWSSERVYELQWERLRKIVSFAFERCPYYASRFRQAGFHPEDLREPKHLFQLPVLTKDDIQENQAGLTARDIPPDSYTNYYTGGSTGSPLSFKVSKSRWVSRTATGLRHNQWCGWRIGNVLGILWGHPNEHIASSAWERLRVTLLQPNVFLNTFNVRESSFGRFITQLRTQKVHYLQAYSRSLLLFAEYLLEHRIEPPPLKAAITTAECLCPNERDFISHTLQCPLFDRYGSREVSVLASECEAHQGLHIPAETLLLEFVVGDRPARPGEAGKILVTDLLNEAMPLIRYEIGDVGSPIEGLCPCGRGLPRMQMVAGRVTDFIHTPEGRWISGVAINTYLLSQLPGVRQAQVVQKQCDHLCFRLIPTDQATDFVETFLRREVPNMFGPRMHHSIEWVQQILPEASGKIRVTISNCGSTHGFSGSPLGSSV